LGSGALESPQKKKLPLASIAMREKGEENGGKKIQGVCIEKKLPAGGPRKGRSLRTILIRKKKTRVCANNERLPWGGGGIRKKKKGLQEQTCEEN